jgi:hypothetical protein
MYLSKYFGWNNSLLYSLLSTWGWSGVYKTTFVDAAVASLGAAVRDAMEQAISRGYIRKSNYPSGSPVP